MKQLKINGHIIAELPEGAVDVGISIANTVPYLDYSLGEFRHYWAVRLPSGHTYTLLGKVPELTEEQAAGMVEAKSSKVKGEIPTFKNYFSAFGFCITAKDSLRSLLRSKGMNPDNFIVIKEN